MLTSPFARSYASRVPDRPLLTRSIEHRICELVAQGVPLIAAARAHGISDTTVMRWMRLGRNGRAPLYRAFYDSVQAARCEYEHGLREIVTATAKRNRVSVTLPDTSQGALRKSALRALGRKTRGRGA